MNTLCPGTTTSLRQQNDLPPSRARRGPRRDGGGESPTKVRGTDPVPPVSGRVASTPPWSDGERGRRFRREPAGTGTSESPDSRRQRKTKVESSPRRTDSHRTSIRSPLLPRSRSPPSPSGQPVSPTKGEPGRDDQTPRTLLGIEPRQVPRRRRRCWVLTPGSLGSTQTRLGDRSGFSRLSRTAPK